MKKFWSAKTLLKQWKDNPQTGKKLSANYILDKALVSRIYKELSNLKSKNSFLKNGQKIWRDNFTKEDTHMVNEHMKICSTLVVVR